MGNANALRLLSVPPKTKDKVTRENSCSSAPPTIVLAIISDSDQGSNETSSCPSTLNWQPPTEEAKQQQQLTRASVKVSIRPTFSRGCSA